MGLIQQDLVAMASNAIPVARIVGEEMDGKMLVISLLAALVVGLVVWVISRERHRTELAVLRGQLETELAQVEGRERAAEVRVAALEVELDAARDDAGELRIREGDLRERAAELTVALEKERSIASEKEALLLKAEERFADTFKALSSDALQSNQAAFLQLAKVSFEKLQEAAQGDLEKRQESIQHLVSPVAKSMEKMDAKLQELEIARTGAYEAIREQVLGLAESQKELRRETTQLVRALSKPTVRGQWGEMQLRRVVELAGMQEYCDFQTQATVTDEEGNKLRPDLVVKLPGGKTIVVDAKAPLASYLESVDAVDDETRAALLVDHARQVRNHVRQLGSKAYQNQFASTPEFVVLFLPGETFFGAALAHDPSLIEAGVDEGVLLATPTTLIALLRSVAYGWRQERLAENAQVICEQGRILHSRLGKLTDHLNKLGRNLGAAVDAYNGSISSLESRVLVTARKFEELEAVSPGKTISSPTQIEQTPRHLILPETIDEEK